MSNDDAKRDDKHGEAPTKCSRCGAPATATWDDDRFGMGWIYRYNPTSAEREAESWKILAHAANARADALRSAEPQRMGPRPDGEPWTDCPWQECIKAGDCRHANECHGAGRWRVPSTTLSHEATHKPDAPRTPEGRALREFIESRSSVAPLTEIEKQVESLHAVWCAYRSNDASSIEVCTTLRSLDWEVLRSLARSATASWISVAERAPDFDVSVLVYGPANENVYAAFRAPTLDGKEWGWRFFADRSGTINEPITHWMPMPRGPVDSSNDKEKP